MNVMENFIVGDETHDVKDFLLTLIVDGMRLFVAVEQGRGKMIDSLLVIVAPKAKVVVKKWISTVCGKEVIAKDKLERLTTFAPHDLPTRT